MDEERIITQRIFEILDKSKKSQKALADYVGVSPNTVTDWRRKTTPSIEKTKLIAEFLNVSLSYLIYGTNEDVDFFQVSKETKKPTSKKKSVIRQPEDIDEIPMSSNPRDVMNKTVIYHDIQERSKPTGRVIGQVALEVNLQCPICHIESKPELVDFRLEEKGKKNCIGFYICQHCHHTFSVLYKNVTYTEPHTYEYFGAVQLPTADSAYSPYRAAVPELPEAFNKPDFAKFRQAYEDLCWAKDYQIDGLVGMAYRRALECLIKDFLISEGYQTEYKNIPEENLANLLQAMSNEIIKDCGRAANHFANDYVHYVDKNPQIDIIEIAEMFDEVLEKITDYLVHKKALRLLDAKNKNLSKNREKTLKNNPTEVLNKLAEENRDLFCEERFVNTTKMYRVMPNKYREEVFTYMKGIITGIGLSLQQILGK